MDEARMIADRDAPGASSRWYVLFVLTAIFSIHYLDRTVLSVVIEPIKQEFGVSDTAMGVLAGFAHSTALSIMVLPMGWLADRTNRVRLVSACVLVWSALTGLSALAGSYTSLLLMRVGVGAAEAGGTPGSASILADTFTRRELPTAMGIYYTAAAIGTGLIFLVGGYVAEFYGWRAVFLIAGLPGIIFGFVLLLTVREPKRMGAAGAEPVKMREAITELRRNRTLLYVIIAGTAASISQAAVWTWMASFLIRHHDLSLGQAGLVVAIAAGAGKGFGSLISGPLARTLAHDRPREIWRAPSLLLSLSVPTAWAMVTVPGAAAAIALAMVLSVMLGSWMGQAPGILMAGAPPRLRATSMSLYHLSTNLIGVGGGAMLAGFISDTVGSLGQAIAWSLTSNLLAAVAFFFAARSLADEPHGATAPAAAH
jgi:predicted MFS family arabinose efflux permease